MTDDQERQHLEQQVADRQQCVMLTVPTYERLKQEAERIGVSVPALADLLIRRAIPSPPDRHEGSHS